MSDVTTKFYKKYVENGERIAYMMHFPTIIHSFTEKVLEVFPDKEIEETNNEFKKLYTEFIKFEAKYMNDIAEKMPETREEREEIFSKFMNYRNKLVLTLLKIITYYNNSLTRIIDDESFRIIDSLDFSLNFHRQKYNYVDVIKLKKYADVVEQIKKSITLLKKFLLRVGEPETLFPIRTTEELLDNILSNDYFRDTVKLTYLVRDYLVTVNPWSKRIVIQLETDLDEIDYPAHGQIPLDKIEEILEKYHYDDPFFIEVYFKENQGQIVKLSEIVEHFEDYYMKPVKIHAYISKRPTTRLRVYEADIIVGKKGDEVLKVRKKFLIPQEPVSFTGRKYKMDENSIKYVSMKMGYLSPPYDEKIDDKELAIGEVPFIVDQPLINKIMEGKEYILYGIPIVFDKSKKSQVMFFYVTNVIDIEDTIEITEEDIEKFNKFKGNLDIVLNSFAPYIENIDDSVKKTKLVLLSTIVRLPELSQVDARDFRHTLIIGDPGIAKTTLLKEITKISPKAIYVDGSSTSGVGLIGGVVKDEILKQFVAVPGVISRAQGGIVGIDEAQELPVKDLEKISEAMEQGHITIAKAGIYQRFPANTTIIMLMNPPRGYIREGEDLYSIVSEWGIKPKIISRFDNIVILRDITNKERDKEIAKSIINNLRGVKKEPPLSLEELRKFIHYVSYHIKVTIPDEVVDYISEKYAELREYYSEINEKYKPRARNVQSIVRTAMAIAKLKQQTEITKEDVDLAIDLMYMNLDLKKKLTTKPQDEINMGEVGKTILKLTSKKQDKTFTYDEVVRELMDSDFDIIDLEEVEEVVQESLEKFEKTFKCIEHVGYTVDYNEKEHNPDDVKYKIYKVKPRKLKQTIDSSK